MREHLRGEPRLLAVALPLVGSYELALLDGVREVAAEHRIEVIPLIGGFEASLRTLLREGAVRGAVADFLSAHWLEEFASSGVRFVQLAHISRLVGWQNVGPDYRGIGRAAAAAFGSGRTRIFIGSAGHHASTEMLAGMQESGPVLSSLRATLMADFLAEIPSPSGILAANDRLACDVIAALQRLGRRIPEETAVIGVGDDRLESLRAGTSLSSFALPGREIGRRAAQMVFDECLEGALVPAILHERESSLPAGDGLERARAYARRHFAEPIGVPDLARAAGMSRRSLELAMLQRHGTSPGRFLQFLRRDQAEKLLRQSDLPILSIGTECGYPEPSVFTAAFRRWTGMSPVEYRQANR